MIELPGLQVLVTGGSRGIGAACCRLLAAAGASVAVHYRASEAAAAELVAALPAPTGPPHLRLRADLARAEEIDALFDRLEAEWGALDALVNNAGVWRENPIDRLDRGQLEECWRINLRAPFLCAARAAPLLAASSRASIVNVTSTAGQRGEARYSFYAASKGALLAATRSWAAELAPGVRVNSVAPGWTDTDMVTEAAAGGGRERIEAGIPLGRFASPDDVAGAVVYLVSPLARHVTGATVNGNGGGVMGVA